jgi:hypothetical protein
MLRRQTNRALHSHRWFSHRSSLRKSSYAITRSAAVATSVAVVAAAAVTIAGQKFVEGPIHNDTPPSVPEAGPSTINDSGVGVKVRVGGGGDDDELRLLVWGSNMSVYFLLLSQSHSLVLPHSLNFFFLFHCEGRELSPLMRRTRCRSVRRRWLPSSGTWRCAIWPCTLRMLPVSTDEGMCISGATGSLADSLRLEIGSLC